MVTITYEDIQKVIQKPINPKVVYSYVYAPKADELIIASKTDVIFCGKQTKIISSCKNIKRGDWYLKNGCICSKTDKNFKYNLTLNSFDDAEFFNNQQILDALDSMLAMDNLKNSVALCKRTH